MLLDSTKIICFSYSFIYNIWNLLSRIYGDYFYYFIYSFFLNVVTPIYLNITFPSFKYIKKSIFTSYFLSSEWFSTLNDFSWFIWPFVEVWLSSYYVFYSSPDLFLIFMMFNVVSSQYMKNR